MSGQWRGLHNPEQSDRWASKVEQGDGGSREVAMSDPLFGPPSTLAVTDILLALDGPDE